MMYYQVPKEVYTEFMRWFKYTSLSVFKVSEFTPVGEWCMVKAIGSSEELEAANNYLDMLIARI